jgi:hypothetical protein
VAVLLAGLVLAAPGCGRKGPPLPPLPRRPAPVAEFGARQQGGAVRVSFRLPRLNLDGSPARIEQIRVFRRRARLEDAAPEGRARLERHFSRGAVDIAELQGEQIAAAADAVGRVEVEDPGVLDDWEPGFLLVYRVLLLGSDSPRWTDSALVFLEPRTAPEPPIRVRARQEAAAVVLEWDPGPPDGPAAAEPVLYNVYRAVGGAAAERRNPEPVRETRFSDPELPAEGESFRFTVRTVLGTSRGLVESDDSAPAEVSTPLQLRPPPPIQLTAAVTGRRIRLIWYLPAEGAVGGFRIYRRSGPEAEFVPIAEVPASEVMFTDGSIRAGIDYHYRVVSFSRTDRQRESEAGETVSARVETVDDEPLMEEE